MAQASTPGTSVLIHRSEEWNFFRDETPERTYDPAAYYEGYFYLHINGEIIHKHITYEFSEGCMYYEHGMVAHIWKNHSAEEVLHWLNEARERQDKGDHLPDAGMAFVKPTTITQFEDLLGKWDEH